MKKLYLLLFAVFGLFATKSYAQPIVNPDTINIGVNFSGVIPGFNILSNDTFNGLPINTSEFIITPLSTSPYISIAGSSVYVQPGTPAGNYYIEYTLCMTAMPSQCGTIGLITVNVCDIVPQPTFTSVEPSCSGLGSITLNGLPAGNWTLQVQSFDNPTQAIPGSGTSYTLQNLEPNQYRIRVILPSGCMSAQVTVNLYGTGLNEMDGDLTGVHVDNNGNGYADVGDTILYTFTVTNGLDCPITNITEIDNTLGLSGILLNSVAANSIGSATYTYILTQLDINQGSVSNYIYFTAQSPGGEVYTKAFGNVALATADSMWLLAFLDLNNDGFKQASEPVFENGTYDVVINNDGVIHHYGASDNGVILYESNPTTTYDVSFNTSNYACTGAYTATASFNDLTVVPGSGINYYLFPVSINPCSNVGVSLVQSGGPRPGLVYFNYILYTNYGTQTAHSGTIAYTKPAATSMLNLTTLTDPAAVETPTGFTLDYTNLLPGETRILWVWLTVSNMPTVAIGDLLTSSVSTTVPAGDTIASDNSATSIATVTNSYDPNNKTETHGGQILFADFTANDYLTYTINFENTGNADAINIQIADVLDAGLDANSFRFITASHPCVYERTGNNLTFNFNGIGLAPDATGYVTFQIKPEAGYAIGDMLPNTASIYFDTNPAIVTNTVETTFVENLGTPHPDANLWKVYPNPSASVVYIHSGNAVMDTVAITDISGKTVLIETPQSSETSVDVSAFAKGVYFVNIGTANVSKTVKFVKE